MGLFGKELEYCVECGAGVPEGRALGSTACRCKDCRKAWTDVADAAISAAKISGEARRKAEAEADRTY